ncbi:MAG TPA: hypothetical protein VG096_06155 [Bryobacteraceae bacterium]|nr:hypothetical protein [Bryobacteraceae bacterium]
MPDFDFSETHVATVEEVFPRQVTRPTDGRPHFNTLMQCAQTMERDKLLIEYIQVCDRIDAFLATTKSSHGAQLEQQRAELWAKCRAAEDDWKAKANNVVQLQSQVNYAAVELNTVRAKARDAAAMSFDSFDTQFPTPEETKELHQKQAAVRTEQEIVAEEYRKLNTQLRAAQHESHEASITLRDLTESLRLVDGELNGFKKR